MNWEYVYFIDPFRWLWSHGLALARKSGHRNKPGFWLFHYWNLNLIPVPITLRAMPSPILPDLLQNHTEKCIHQIDLPFVILHLRWHSRKLAINFSTGVVWGWHKAGIIAVYIGSVCIRRSGCLSWLLHWSGIHQFPTACEDFWWCWIWFKQREQPLALKVSLGIRKGQ